MRDDDDDDDPSMVLSLKDGNEIQCICAHSFAVGVEFLSLVLASVLA